MATPATIKSWEEEMGTNYTAEPEMIESGETTAGLKLPVALLVTIRFGGMKAKMKLMVDMA